MKQQYWYYALCCCVCILRLFLDETRGFAQIDDTFSWTLHHQPNSDIEIDDGTCEDLFVTTSHSPTFFIGMTCTTTSCPGGAGISLDSLDVSLLPETPDLLHVAWTNIGAGASGSYGGKFLVCRADTPESILLEGSMNFYGTIGKGGFAKKRIHSRMRTGN